MNEADALDLARAAIWLAIVGAVRQGNLLTIREDRRRSRSVHGD